MKMAFPFALTITLVWSCGCASPERITLLPAVGPAGAQTPQGKSNGFLQVYSAREEAFGNVPGGLVLSNDEFGSNDILHGAAHTSYTIFGADGKVLQKVRNSAGMNDPHPTRVELPPGFYRIKAEAEDYDSITSTVMIPVLIDSGLTTLVRLDGSWKSRGINPNDVVKLPNGKLVGWRVPNSGRLQVGVGYSN